MNVASRETLKERQEHDLDIHPKRPITNVVQIQINTT